MRAQILIPSGVCSSIGQRIHFSFMGQNLRLFPCAKLSPHSMSLHGRYRLRLVSLLSLSRRQRNSAWTGHGQRSRSIRVLGAAMMAHGRLAGGMPETRGRAHRGSSALAEDPRGFPMSSTTLRRFARSSRTERQRCLHARTSRQSRDTRRSSTSARRYPDLEHRHHDRH